MPKRIKVTEESESERNLRFHHDHTGADMTRSQLVRHRHLRFHLREFHRWRLLFRIPTSQTTINSVRMTEVF
jgi:hypothetical protein